MACVDLSSLRPRVARALVGPVLPPSAKREVRAHRPLITHRGTRRAERYAAPGKGQSVTPIGGRSR